MGLFLLLVLILIGFLAYQGWATMKDSLWNGQNRLTIGFNTQPVLLVSFDPQRERLIFLSVPEGTNLQAIRGYGVYRVGSLWELGMIENREGTLFIESLENSLAVPVDAWISPPDQDQVVEFLLGVDAQTRKQYFLASLLTTLRSLETNLTRWDLFRLWRQVQSVGHRQISLVDLAQANVLEVKKLADGSQAWEVDSKRLDVLLADLFPDTKIKEENLSIAVYNGTDFSGLANQAARLISNLGGRVVEVGDREAKTDQCLVLSEEDQAASRTVKKLIKVFDCQFQPTTMTKERGAVVVILGEAYWRLINER